MLKQFVCWKLGNHESSRPPHESKSTKTKGRKHESLTANRPRPGAIKNRINKGYLEMPQNAAIYTLEIPHGYPKSWFAKGISFQIWPFWNINMLVFEGVLLQKPFHSSSLAPPKLDIIKEGSFSPHDIHTSVQRDTLSSSKCVVLSP